MAIRYGCLRIASGAAAVYAVLIKARKFPVSPSESRLMEYAAISVMATAPILVLIRLPLFIAGAKGGGNFWGNTYTYSCFIYHYS